MADRLFLASYSFLIELAQPERLRDIADDTERIDKIRASLIEDGLEQPLEICVDRYGRIALRDGHHRLLAMIGLDGFASLPVFFSPSEGIRVTSQMMMHVLERLLRHVRPIG